MSKKSSTFVPQFETRYVQTIIHHRTPLRRQRGGISHEHRRFATQCAGCRGGSIQRLYSSSSDVYRFVVRVASHDAGATFKHRARVSTFPGGLVARVVPEFGECAGAYSYASVHRVCESGRLDRPLQQCHRTPQQTDQSCHQLCRGL